jgi:GGDEF domain-containing protein
MAPTIAITPGVIGRIRDLANRWNPEDLAVQTGRALLLATGVVVTSTVGALHPSHSDWVAVGWISLIMCAVLLGSFIVPWRTIPSGWTGIFPVSAIAAIASLGVFAHPEIGSCYLGLFVLCVAHVGVFQPLHSTFALVAVGAPAYLVVQDRWDAYIAIRLAIACAIWVILGEVLALLMRHQHLITELLQRAALTDVLTGVGTRRDLDNHIEAVGFGDTFVLCDLDNFKRVNDTLGHAAGDAILRDFGTILRGSLRGDDYAGRYGGEEFVLILADTDEAETEQVLDRSPILISIWRRPTRPCMRPKPPGAIALSGPRNRSSAPVTPHRRPTAGLAPTAATNHRTTELGSPVVADQRWSSYPSSAGTSR